MKRHDLHSRATKWVQELVTKVSAGVRPSDQPKAPIQIVGHSRIGFASSVKTEKPVQWLVAAIVVIVVVLVTIIVVTQVT